jgi:hypothetical protein
MGMVVTLFLAIGAMVVGYAAFGQGGGVAGMIFFGILIIGAAVRTLKQVQSS